MRELARSRLFWLGLALRVAALPFFGSSFMRDLFIPFLTSAVQHPGVNPWSLLPPRYFPYGSFLFALLYVPFQLAHWALGADVAMPLWLSLTLCKLPLLVMELVLLAALARCTRRPKSLLTHYWLNPVLLYITYVHGQLDAVVTACAFVSLLLLINRRTVASAVVMACALSSKFQVALLVPFALAYVTNRDYTPRAWRQAALWLGVFAAVGALGFLPLLKTHEFGYASVMSPEALRVFGARLDVGPQTPFYLGVAVVLAVLGRLCVSTRLTEAALIYGSGVLLGLLVVATGAAPGWYYWPLPFLALLYANYRNAPLFPWYLTLATYLALFGVLPFFADVPLLGGVELKGVVFTALQTALASVLLVAWIVAVQREARLERYIKPLMIGIAGDSGVGKSTLSASLLQLFGQDATAVIEGDDYHKWERGDANYKRLTHLSPDANSLGTLDRHTRSLVAGRSVHQRHYDHDDGRFTRPREVASNRTVVVQGLHTFYLRAMRGQFDLKIFLEPDELVQLAWKIRRDVHERGYDVARVVSSLETRRRDSLAHIAPQRAYADWIIQAQPREPVTRSQILAGVQPTIRMRHVFWNDAQIEELADALDRLGGLNVALERPVGDLERVALVTDGTPSVATIEHLATRLFRSPRHLTRSARAPRWQAGQAGLMQLIALVLLDTQHGTTREDFAFGMDQAPGQPDERADDGPGGLGSGDRRPQPDAGEDLASVS